MKQQSAMPKNGHDPQHGRRHNETPEVIAITNAAIPHSDDTRHRMIQYSITMGIRMVCLASLFLFDGWYKLIPALGAVVLPWVAVMIANAGANNLANPEAALIDAPPQQAIPQGTPMEEDASSDILPGEIVADDDEEQP